MMAHIVICLTRHGHDFGSIGTPQLLSIGMGAKPARAERARADYSPNAGRHYARLASMQAHAAHL